MNSFLLILILLSAFFLLVLAFFALSSCLGDEIRAVWGRRRNQRSGIIPTTYALQYARSMGQHQGGYEHIEMENMLGRQDDEHDD